MTQSTERLEVGPSIALPWRAEGGWEWQLREVVGGFEP